jgi:(E)-4-hydroxy-3-methylbut-2-enyl-diphosphate synthase
VGSEHPIALQTMTTTDTRDVEGTVEQVKRCADAGADIVRLTVQGKREAESCFKIRERLFQVRNARPSATRLPSTLTCPVLHIADAESTDEVGPCYSRMAEQQRTGLQDKYDTPLVADIHFQPVVAMMVAEAFEKVRVNPGNFVDGRKKFDEINYDDPAQFEAEREHIEEVFTPLVLKCKELGTAIRIGTNHGSLSARILSFYGDTPAGMVSSAFEFADICRKHDYHNFLFSMKASNPLVMVAAYRLLAEEGVTGVHFSGDRRRAGHQHRPGAAPWPCSRLAPATNGATLQHLRNGTGCYAEAGEGEDGRMKSAIGIGSLLMDGLGDTIRVSLTEDPEYELDPCRRLAALGNQAVTAGWGVEDFGEKTRDTHTFSRRQGTLPEQRDTDGNTDYRNVLHRCCAAHCSAMVCATCARHTHAPVTRGLLQGRLRVHRGHCGRSQAAGAAVRSARLQARGGNAVQGHRVV